MASRTQAPGSSSFSLLVIVALVVTALGVVFNLPLYVFTWPLVMAGACLEPLPLMSGKNPRTKQPEPLEHEIAGVRTATKIRDLRRHLAFPSALWMPGKGVQRSFVGALMLAAMVVLLPLEVPAWLREHAKLTDEQYHQIISISRMLGALAAFSLVHVGAGVNRAVEAHPGVRMTSLPGWLKSHRIYAGIALAFALAGSIASLVFLSDHPRGFTPTLGVLASWLLAGVIIARPWGSDVLAAWKEEQAARAAWSNRWAEMKVVPEPQLVKHDVRFAPGMVCDVVKSGSAADLASPNFRPKFEGQFGGDFRVFALLHPRESGEGVDPNLVDIYQWSDSFRPDVIDPNIDPDLLRAWVNCMGALTFDNHGANGRSAARLLLGSIEAVHAPDSPKAVWATTWKRRPGAEFTIADRREYGLHDEFGPRVHANALIDHRDGAAPDGQGILYFGAIGDPETIYADESMAQRFERMAEEDEWRGRWSKIGPSRLSGNVPVPQFDQETSGELVTGAVVNRLPFITRVGINASEYFGLEPELSATLSAAPFVSISGWPAAAGERHAQAFSVFWSHDAVPTSPENLAPHTDERGNPLMSMTPQMPNAPEAWVLQGMVSRAFEQAKLKRPDLGRVTCLSDPTKRKHLWDMDVRMREGVTLPAVQAKIEPLRQALNVSWLRVSSSATPGSFRLVAGADPERITLHRPERDAEKLAALDWEQTFRLSGLIDKEGGNQAKLLSRTPLEGNPDVSELVFELPAGVTLDRLRANRSKLQQISQNAFVEPSALPKRGPNYARVLVARRHPLPFPAPYDFTIAPTSHEAGIPFATDVEGNTVFLDFWEGAHALVAGTQGSGKSVTAQALLYGCRVQGMQVAVIDAQKKAVDFEFLRQHAVGFATDVESAAALMRAVYAEGRRRMDLAAQYKVGHALKVPEHARPPRLVVFIDEFTSLMGTEAVPKADPADVEAVAEAEFIAFMNSLRSSIGTSTGKVAREWRAAGISLMLGTQKLDAKILDSIRGASDLKDNLARMLLGNPSQGAKQSALRAPFDAPDLGDEVPKGRGYWESLSMTRAVVIQSWYADQGAEEGAYAPGTFAYELDAALEGQPAHEPFDLEPFRAKRNDSNVGVIGELPASLRGEAEAEPEVEVVTLESAAISLEDLFALDSDEGESESEPESEPEPVVEVESEPAPEPPVDDVTSDTPELAEMPDFVEPAEPLVKWADDEFPDSPMFGDELAHEPNHESQTPVITPLAPATLFDIDFDSDADDEAEGDDVLRPFEPQPELEGDAEPRVQVESSDGVIMPPAVTKLVRRRR